MHKSINIHMQIIILYYYLGIICKKYIIETYTNNI